MSNATPIYGYKVFNPDWSCRPDKDKAPMFYVVGETYEIEGELIICKNGIHYCSRVVDCFNYYSFCPNNKVALVEILGNIVTKEDKSATNRLKVVRELTWEEVLKLVNSGVANSGISNSGDWNSGSRNSGSRNSGDWNSGYLNSGDLNSGSWNSGSRNSGSWNSGSRNSGDLNSGSLNSGDWNSGSRNSGSRNSGSRNSGSWNSGSRNSGSWNSGDWNSGYLNTITPEKYIFNKPTKETNINFPDFFFFKLTDWVEESFMSDAEKLENPSYSFTGGYLKKYGYKEAWQLSYNQASEEDKAKVKLLPNFDADIFFEITGIRID